MGLGLGGGLGAFPLGAGPFGIGGNSILSARAVALNAVDVLFDVLPTAVDPAAVGDALNPRNWTVSVFEPFGATVRLTQLVERLKDGLTLRVFFDGVFDGGATYEIEVDPVTGVLTNTALFIGLFGPRPLNVAELEELFDVANPFLLKDATFNPPNLGTYQLTDGGDIGSDKGRTNLRKRIFRRLSVTPTGFFHLDNYGLETGEKGLIRPDDLRQLKSRAEAQVLQEPEVVGVRIEASVDPRSPNVVNLLVKARDNIGNLDPFSVPIVIG